MVAALAVKFDEQKRQVVRLLTFLTVLLAALYGYFLIASVIHALMYNEYAQKTAAIESAMSNVEAEYLNATTMLSKATANNIGLYDAPPAKFLSRSTVSDSLTLRQ